MKLYRGGVMGDIAYNALMKIPHVELVTGDDFDILFSASFPNRITQEECNKARVGAVNIHTSLLPEGRGSHPLNWALIWGKKETGITIHKIVDTYDAGDICYQFKCFIRDDDNIVSLRGRIESLFPVVIEEFFYAPKDYIEKATPQNQAKASYAQKRLPEDCQLNLKAPVEDTVNLFRSCHPVDYPAFIVVGGSKILITKLEYLEKWINKKQQM